MFGNKKSANANTSNIDTLLGSSCTINGDIITKNSIKIDGQINGNVTADGSIVVAENGAIKGDVKSKELIVFGAIEGVIRTESLHLQPTSKITGEINTQSLNVETGAIYEGAVHMKKQTPTAPTNNAGNNASNNTASNAGTKTPEAAPKKVKL